MAKEKEEKKLSLLDTKLKEIEKEYGKGTIRQLGKTPIEPIKVISTGSILIDQASGIGGLPRGRIVEVFSSQESSGKTTFALSVARECQQAGGRAAIIDSEHASDLNYAKKIGVDINKLLFSQPDTAEQALGILEKLVESESVDLIIVDSVAALTPKAVLEGEVGASHMAMLARLMSQELNRVKGKVNKSNCCVIFVNQMRQTINTSPMGAKWITCGGQALKFYSSVRIQLIRTKKLQDSDKVPYGIVVKAKFVKNKLADPYKEVDFAIYFTDGLSRYSDVFNAGITYGVIDKSGSWFSYSGDKIGQGERKALEYLKANDNVYQKIKSEVMQIMGEE